MNDTVHGYIDIPSYAKIIINTPVFQRLRHIKQLTSASYVFPGAVHSRIEHSTGVMHLSNKYAKHLFGNDEYKIKLLTVAGLLHDAAHGCYSHAWDSTIYSEIYPGCEKGHDIHRYRLVRELLKPQLDEINVNPEDIINIWNGSEKTMSAIIKGGLSTDRFDFINRDTYYTGTKHFGFFDIDRIINNTSIYDNNITYNEKIVPDIIQGLLSRINMYKQVYLHKTVIAAAVLIELMIKESKDYLKLVDKTNNLDEFVYLTDEYIFNTILHSDNQELLVSKSYAKSLFVRKLPKMIEEEIINLSEEENCNSGTFLCDDGKSVIWISRVLLDNFGKEVSDIYIKTNDNKYILFKDYCPNIYVPAHQNRYYIRRKYVL